MNTMKLNTSEKPLAIFVVEDDLWYGELLVHHLQMNPENKVKRFESGKDLLNALDEKPHIITLDYSLPDIKGDELLKILKSKVPDSEIVIVSGQEDINTALTMMRFGVYDYIVKNEETKERLWNAVHHIRNKVSLEEEVKHLRLQIGDKNDLRNMIVGNSEQMNHVFNLISKAITTTINVSLTGETGTGKELVARAIHLNSSRANKPFVAVNATAIPRDLMESELFGHEKGSFTGAINTRIGKFEESNGGTLFLDEIADLDFSIQVKLLRVLQEREITRVGSNQIIPIDVRIITATHKNLSEEVRVGLFREDLFYRLLGLPIQMPPLKTRGNDILLLAKQFLDSFCSLNKLSRKSFSVAAKEKLLAYQYPGNVRELKAVVELSAVMTISDQIDVEDISFTATRTPVDLLDQDCTLDEFIYKIIRYYLDRYDNNVIETAKKLDIGKSTIYRLIKEGKL